MGPWLSNELIGKRIREIRESRGMSQQELAAHLGAPGSQSEVSKWERGRRKPSYETLRSIAEIAGEDVTIFQVNGTPRLREGSVEEPYGSLTPDPEGTPAEQLLHMLGERAGMRRVAKELTTHDLIATAYVLARRYDFSPEELKKIDAWRDQIIADEEERD